MDIASVNITSSPPGTLLTNHPGGEEVLQIICASVQVNATSPARHVAIVNSGLSSELREVVNRDFRATNAEASVAFLAVDREGYACVISDDGRGDSYFPVAAAVAVIKASWGWDESERLLIRVNDREMRVRAHYDGGRWVVSEEEL
ncbi:MAG TPA: hypothetical protein VN256_22495 [Pyrinomonadaceae bacterium]|nr:hypothetical protein [Pyrinomonadaceae bacterium]